MDMDIDLRCQDVESMIASLPDGAADFVAADPPWEYSRDNKVMAHYDGVAGEIIAGVLASTHRIAAPDSYLAVWCTFPKLWEWAAHDGIMRKAGWRYVSGGAWGKRDRLTGCGFHFRGDAEIVLLYVKGHPVPLGGSKSNLWLEARGEHSEKPQTALRALISMAAPVGGLVVDCYAGQSASLARACRALGRRYVGAELDLARHARAILRLSQQEMVLCEASA